MERALIPRDRVVRLAARGAVIGLKINLVKTEGPFVPPHFGGFPSHEGIAPKVLVLVIANKLTGIAGLVQVLLEHQSDRLFDSPASQVLGVGIRCRVGAQSQGHFRER